MEEQNNQNIEVKSADNKSTTLMVVGGLVLVGVLVGGYLLMNRSKAGESMTTSNDTQVTPVTQNTNAESVEETSESMGEAIAEDNIVLDVEGGSFYFKPNVIRAKVGQTVKIRLTSVGGMPHNFSLDEFDVKTQDIGEGETADVEFTPNQAGSFEFYCSVGSHRQMGMKGTLIVE